MRREEKSENNKKERKHIETLLDKKQDLESLMHVKEYEDNLVRRLVRSIKIILMEVWK